MTNKFHAILEASKAAAIREMIGEGDDVLIHDMVEGETSLYEILDQIVNEIDETESMIVGIKSRQDDLAARKKRLEDRKDNLRDLIGRVMAVAGERKVELDTATVSLGAEAQKVMVTNVDELPEAFITVKVERKADLKAIGDALKAGENVVGASLSNGGQRLTIRRG